MYGTGDGTITDVVNELDTTVNLYQSVDDSPLSPTDTDWINNNAVEVASVFLDITNPPADFLTATSATILVRYRGQYWAGGSLKLFAQAFQSDESTALSDEVEIVTVSGDTSFANTSAITLTNLAAGSKAIWNGARIRFRWGST